MTPLLQPAVERRPSWLRRELRALLVPPAQRLGPLDGLRALAILWTMAFHTVFISGFRPSATPAELWSFIDQPWNRPILRADLGVDLLFVLSGFLIGGLLLDEHRRSGTIAFGRFQLRRLLRIVPAYAAVLGLGLLATGGLDAERVWANLLFVNNYVSFTRQTMPWSWSLGVEGQLYVLLPFVVLLVWRHERARLPVLLGLLLAAFAIRAAVVARLGISLPVSLHPRLERESYLRYIDDVYQATHLRFGAVIAGLLAAHLARCGAAAWLEARRRLALAAVAVATLVIAAVIAVPAFRPSPWNGAAGTAYIAVFPYVFSLAAAYLVLVLAAAPSLLPRLVRVLSTRAFYPVSQLSYSMYLVHPIVMFAGWMTVLDRPAPSFALAYVAFVFASLLAAALLWLLVERPFHRLRPP